MSGRVGNAEATLNVVDIGAASESEKAQVQLEYYDLRCAWIYAHCSRELVVQKLPRGWLDLM
jgi:hypothetical protein